MSFIFSLAINKYYVLQIIWNLFLALIPCFVAYYTADSLKKKKWKQLDDIEKIGFFLIFLFWLFLFPNTAYLFSIPRHLVDYCSSYNKYRVCLDTGRTWMVFFFFLYSLLGVPAFYYGLKKMSQIFKSLINGTASVVLQVIVIPLTSIGVMFGLFERYNSWDVLLNPINLLKALIIYFSDANLLFTFLFFTAVLFAVYYGLDIFIKKIRID